MNTMTSPSDRDIFRSHIKLQLQDILSDQPNTLKAAVAREVLAEDCPVDFLTGLMAHGCISGWVTSLVWYNQTHEFYDTHYAEIEDLRLDWEDETGQPLEIKGDLKNFFAWFAFEHIALVMMHELGLD